MSGPAKHAGPAFCGFPPSALEFWAGLEDDNTKAYWTGHRETYDRDVRGPMEALVHELCRFGDFRIFRPHRDIRFSADKSPYKTHIGAVSETAAGALYYVQLSADGLFAAAGYHQMTPDQLERFRAAVSDEDLGGELASICETLERSRYELGGEALKTAPRGYPRDHPRVRWLRHKDLTMGRHFPPAAWLHTRGVTSRVQRVFSEAGPLNAWLDRHVGPPRA